MAGCDNGGPVIPGGGLSEKPLPPVTPGDPPDIQTFLNSNKDRVDADPEANPYDDLRHYAYEGDGNSGGSLSSLNSGEDDADLEFEYLHNFGPRFKKLADMYGRESDSESDQEVGRELLFIFCCGYLACAIVHTGRVCMIRVPRQIFLWHIGHSDLEHSMVTCNVV